MRVAFITNGVVCNVAELAEADDNLANAIQAEHGCEMWKYDENASVGWTFDGKKFAPPAPTQEQLAAIAEAKAATEAAAAKKAAILAALADATGYNADELREALNA